MSSISHRLGVDAFHWTDTFTEDTLWIAERASQLGFLFLETAVRDPRNFPTRKLQQAARTQNLGLILKTALPPASSPVSDDPDTRTRAFNHIKAVIDCAVESGADIICGLLHTHWGVPEKRLPTPDERQRSLDHMARASDYAHRASSNLTMVLELVNRYETNMLTTVRDGLNYCSELDRDNVRLHLDTYHMLREEPSLYNAIRDASRHLGYIHLSESTRGKIGEGTVPWNQVIQALNDIPYQGPLVLESFAPQLSMSKICHVWKSYSKDGETLARDNLQQFLTMHDTRKSQNPKNPLSTIPNPQPPGTPA